MITIPVVWYFGAVLLFNLGIEGALLVYIIRQDKKIKELKKNG